ncbi:hypothetical protein ACWDUL_27995 [Nocardia niigatensis]|uniref:hypothetical protein n=1 Tax=Nocardia niigatensis TaxID=209249 RepID=UPI00031C4672|nr:hypothetical protein [Nocardia niigatensis]
MLVALTDGFAVVGLAVDFPESLEQPATSATTGVIVSTAIRVAVCRRDRPRHSARADIDSS